MSLDFYDTPILRNLNEQLATANKFDPSALPLNRQGKLAASQKKILYTRLAWLSGVFFLLLFTVFYQYFRTETKPNNTTAVIYFALLLWLLYTIMKTLADLKSGTVQSVEGEGYAILKREHDNENPALETLSYYYQIGSERFLVKSEDAYNALLNAARYRAYYLPKDKTLVNIEALTPPPA
jgi:hypothetical protein